MPWTWIAGERLALLRMMGETVAGSASREVAATCFGRLGVLSTIQTHRGEAELLARFPECLALLENLSPHERCWCGRCWPPSWRDRRGLMYFESHAAVSCPEQLEHYTYMVAGA